MKFSMSSACIGAILAAFNFQGSSALTCTASAVDGFPEPDHPEVNPRLMCTTNDGQLINIDGAREEILSRNDFHSGQTQLSIPSEIISEDLDGMDGGYVNVNRENLGKIELINQPHESRRRLTKEGIKSVLVIIVTDGTNSPTQNEAKMYNDVFGDENNLVSLFDKLFNCYFQTCSSVIFFDSSISSIMNFCRKLFMKNARMVNLNLNQQVEQMLTME